MRNGTPLVRRDGPIAVIGLGAAGIAAVIGLRESGFQNITVYEATKVVGGTWVYSPSSEHAQSSMYESLRCNIPKQSMSFRGRPFPPQVPSFAPHRDVASYLQRITTSEAIYPLVRFQSPVAVCTPVNPGSLTTRWAIQTYVDVDECSELIWESMTDGGNARVPVRDTDGSHTPCLSDPEFFDAVIVCNGHYTVPNKWRPGGYENFPGTISHSHFYRTPDRFIGKKVIVLGKGPSGTDIALELRRCGADVILSHEGGEGEMDYGDLVPQVPSVTEVRSNGSVVLRDGSIVSDVDELLLCTGYAYSFPFLHDSAGISVSKDRRSVDGLLSHCVVEKHPTLSLIGLPFKVVPFPMFMDQACFIGAMLSGQLPFPLTRSSLANLRSSERLELDNTAPSKYLHCLGDRQWEYRRKLASWSGAPLPGEVGREIYNDARAARNRDPADYRRREYVVFGNDPGEWRVTVGDCDITGQEDPNNAPVH